MHRGGDRLNQNAFAFITCVNNDDWYNECQLYLRHLTVPDDFTVEFIPVRNAKSMTGGYNSAMQLSDAKYKVYLHQDTLVVNKNFIADLLEIFADPTIGAIGMIGCRNLPRSGVWWDGLRTYGRVLHACEPESVVDSHCSEPDAPIVDVQSVDGLFIATQYDLPWRTELFDGWHLYDTSLCMEMQRAGYRVVVPHADYRANIVRRKNRWRPPINTTKKFSSANTVKNSIPKSEVNHYVRTAEFKSVTVESSAG